MPLSPQQIQKFEQALKGPPPVGDPNWEVTRGLLELTVLQAKQILSLQAQLEALAGSNMAATRNLVDALRRGKGAKVGRGALDPGEVRAALDGLNAAIQAHQRGESLTKYAVNILKFAAVVLI